MRGLACLRKTLAQLLRPTSATDEPLTCDESFRDDRSRRQDNNLALFWQAARSIWAYRSNKFLRFCAK